MTQLNQIGHSICIVNYEGAQCLAACLDALIANAVADQEIIVVDNASKDDSVKLINQRYPGVKVLELPDNFGPAAARNAGYARATYNRILFVDNDVVVTANICRYLNEALNFDQSVAVAMPRVCYSSAPSVVQYDGASCHPMGQMITHHANLPVCELDNSTREIGSVVTACFMLDRARIAVDGPFDESFFFNYEDHDFGVRCRIAGHRIVSVPKALCYHGSGTENLSYRPAGHYAKRRVYFLIRNRWQVLLKNYQLRTLILLFPAFSLYEMVQFVGVIRKGWFLEWLRSVAWIFRNLPEILRKRRRIQQGRYVDDVMFIENAPLPFTIDLVQSKIQSIAVTALNKILGSYYQVVRPML